MKQSVFKIGVVASFFATASLLGQEKANNDVEKLDEVVITATKFEIKKEKIGKIIYQIKEKELQNLKGKTVTAILDNIAGIHINGSNNSDGKNKSTYIRGGRDRQVLILIDGIPVNDPSGIITTFDLRLLTLSQIESIEVMNGAASTLYGSGAATGVINITLKKASKKPISLNYQVALGTNNSQDEATSNLTDVSQNFSINGTLNKFSYLASINASLVDGLSEASDKDSQKIYNDDKFSATNVFARMGYELSKKVTLEAFTNFDKDVYDYDAGAFTDSDINNGENKQFRIGVSSNFNYEKGNLKLVASYNKVNRFFDSFNSWGNVIDHYEYTGKTTVLDIVNNYKLTSNFQLITGLNYQKQENLTNSPYGNIDDDLANNYIVDPYITAVYNASNGFNLNIGARLNNHSEYGNHLVYNINPSYNVSGKFRLLASYSTAFIAPSTYQLFSQYGNVDLKPEENKTVEVGFELLNKAFEINSVFFYREEDSAIILPDFITYSNSDEGINAKGVETNVTLKTFHKSSIRLSHSYVHKSADVDYIPENKITALIETNSLKHTYLSLRFKNISKRTYFDQWGTGENINLDAYNLVDFYASHQLIANRLSVFAQINNIFNEDYIETIGYTTKGRNYKIGLDFTF